MPKQGTRQEVEHRLAGYVSEWIAECEQKALAMKEHNDAIKAIELRIEALSAEIEGGAYQPGLPFEEPKAEPTAAQTAVQRLDVAQKRAAKRKPVITLAEEEKSEPPEPPASPTPPEPATPGNAPQSLVHYGKGCTVCAPLRCEAYSGLPGGACRTCGHREEYHKGPGAMVDPLGVAEASGVADASL